MSQVLEASPLSTRASLHEHSVQAIARGDVGPRKKPRAFNGREVRTRTIRSVRVDPKVMIVALGLAGGDCSRLRIISESAVLVLNNKRGM